MGARNDGRGKYELSGTLLVNTNFYLPEYVTDDILLQMNPQVQRNGSRRVSDSGVAFSDSMAE